MFSTTLTVRETRTRKVASGLAAVATACSIRPSSNVALQHISAALG